MTRGKDTTTIGLYVGTKPERDYFEIFAYPVTIGRNAYERRSIDSGGTVDNDITHLSIRNPRDEAINGLRLDNLHISAIGSQSDDPRRLFGFDVRYKDVYTLDRRNAPAFAKTLTTIDKRLDKLTDKFGNASTFGAYLARVAAAIGATQIVFAVDANKHGSSYRDNKHNIVSLRDGAYRVDRMVDEWVHERDAKVVPA